MAGIDALLEIMTRLRDPEGGCPWDLEQDFASISPHTIEEAYEVDEAIANGDLEALRDELGDLLFQVVFQARIAEELGVFDFGGVVDAIVSKLIRRHPHVFAGARTPQSVEDQAASWEAIKAEERAAAGRETSEGRPDPFAGIPRSLPALARSAKLDGRLARLEAEGATGRDADATPTLVERLSTETSRAIGLLESDRNEDPDRAAALRVVGEGLRAWAALARRLGVDPEQALRRIDDETISVTLRNVHQARQPSDR
jgi:MazG family protein